MAAPILRSHHQGKAGGEGRLSSASGVSMLWEGGRCPKRIKSYLPDYPYEISIHLVRWAAPNAAGRGLRRGQDKGYEGGDLNKARPGRCWRGLKQPSGLFADGDTDTRPAPVAQANSEALVARMCKDQGRDSSPMGGA